MIASPWVEREVRSRMPFGATTDADRAAPAGEAQEQADEAKVQQRLQSLEDRPPVATSDETLTTLSEPAKRLGALEQRIDAIDRKSVVSGKGVSVRVDLGGRGTIKKK